MWYSRESWRKSSTASERENECNRPFKVRTLFWTKNSRTFKDTYTIFQALYLVNKSLESVFFSSSTSSHQEQFYPEGRSVFAPLRLFRTVWFGITLACTEITGISSTNCNSQGLSRCVQTLALLQLVKLGTLRSDNGDANERSLKNRLRSLSNFLAPIPSHLVT